VVDRAKQRLAALSDEQRRLLARRLIERRGANDAREIPLQDRESVTSFPLSFAQQRIWFLHQLAPTTTAFNIAETHVLRGSLDLEALQRSLNEIVRRHEVLRSTFELRDGVPVQRVTDELTLALPVEDLSSLSDDERRVRVEQGLGEEYQRPWDLTTGPPLRACLYRLGDDQHLFALTTHHVVSDGWSAALLSKELGALYTAFSRGEASPLPEPTLQYADFAVWQQERLQGQVEDKLLTYWLGQLDGHTPLELPVDDAVDNPVDSGGGTVTANHGVHEWMVLPADLSHALKAFSQREDVTLFMTLLSALATLLQSYSGQTDIVIGSPVANRNRAELFGLIGCFMNPLPFRVDLAGRPSFRELLARVRKTALQAFEHQELPFNTLVKALHPRRDPSNTPIFQVLLLHQNYGWQPPALGELTSGATLEESLDELDGYRSTGALAYPVAVEIYEFGPRIAIKLEYADSYATTLAGMSRHMKTLLGRLVEAPDVPIASSMMLPTSERDQLLGEWSCPPHSEREPDSVVTLFERQAARTPDATAVLCGERALTYTELNGRANALARCLRTRGVGAETLVGICLERSADMLVAILGILKAGGAFVPLDPDYPRDRLASMQEAARLRLLVSQASLLDELPAQDLDVVLVDGPEVTGFANENLDVSIHERSAAYVIFTSGSTGTPNPVVVAHRSLSHYARHAAEQFEIDAGDRVLQFASISFDTAAEEIFPSLLRGAALVVRTDDMVRSVDTLLHACRDAGITVLDLPTSFWHEITSELGAEHVQLPDELRLVIIGGEAARADCLEAWQQHVGAHVRLWNTYGPTEATIVATSCELAIDVPRTPETEAPSNGSNGSASVVHKARGSVSIGAPIGGARVYVLDRHMEPLPLGAIGELYIGGVGLARGYMDRPALSAERFVPDPFSDEPGTRIYRSGDLCRWLPGGQLEYCGRRDHQVKLRGFRIELGEIEAVLGEHGALDQVAVVLRKDEPDQERLVAYATGRKNAPDPDVAELRRFLKERLPVHMVPSAVMLLDSFPLTVNGKIDRATLPAPDGRRLAEQVFVAPRTETEQRIAGLWRETLQVQKVGIHDNFFDLGGHSLLVVKLHARLREEFASDVSVLDLFRFPTVAALAEQLQGEEVAPRTWKIEAVRDWAERRKRHTAGESIAVIGMSARFPQAPDTGQFWRNLCAGTECVTFFTDHELRASGVPEEWLHDARYVKAKATLDDIELFDAGFFGYAPGDAELMDPQHRLFLECGWHALEDAGHRPESFPGAIGVFAGVGANSYLFNLFGRPEAARAIATDKDFVTTRLSYHLNLGGPSVAVQTACSTSLVAVCQAAASLLDHQCDMALAGGSNVSVPMRAGYFHQEGGVFSSDGHCRAFDATGDGFVPGAGVGVVVLKRLSDAIADGDPIRAVIKGFAVNNDGSAKIGYTAPSVDRQAEVIAMAQALAGVDADSIGYVEAHGTATRLGDPIELAALTQAFRAQTQKSEFCAIGSVKTNVGHLDAAAGVAGLIKAVLALEHKTIPPSLHYEHPNPEIDLTRTPFYVSTSLQPWDSAQHPRRAAVSSFGIGGTNAHLVLEEAPAAAPATPSRNWHLITLSGKTPAALERNAAAFVAWARAHPDAELADVAYTLNVGRRHFDNRHAACCRTLAEAVDQLSAFRGPVDSPASTDEPASAAEQQARALARLWAGGGEPDWSAYYENETRQRVSLPGYAFERERHWLEPVASVGAPAARGMTGAPIVSPGAAQVGLFLPSWKRTLPPKPGSDGTSAGTRFLLLGDSSGVAEEVAAQLRLAGVSVSLDHEHGLVTALRDDYVRLFSELASSDGLPHTIVSFRGLDGDESAPNRAFFELLALAQALATTVRSAQLIVITAGGYSVTGHEELRPESATAFGPCRVIPQEFPGTSCRQIDIDPAALDVDRLVDELASTQDDPVVALRGIDRLTPAFEPVSIDAPAEGLPDRLREGGVYLITGGLGGIGLALAGYLARTAGARLILTSREGLPDRSAWVGHAMRRGEDDPTSRKIRAVQALGNAGAEVMVARADVTDERRMAELVDEVEARFGPIDGVVHAAGVPGGGVIPLRDADDAAAVLAPKVTGAKVLAQLFAGRDLEFLLFCSSTTSLLGGVGQVDYCAANAYLDALAHARARAGDDFVLSVNWDAWGEVGMAADAELPPDLADLQEEIVARGLSTEEGQDVFQRCLSGPRVPQLAVSKATVPATQGPGASAAQDAQPHAERPRHPRPQLPVAYLAPRNDVEREVCAIWQEALGIEQVGVHDSFFELGGHSLMALGVAAAINEKLGSALPAATLYEVLTPEGLAQRLAHRQAEPEPGPGTGPGTQPAGKQA
jgi:polyketide synthase PksJ